MYVTIEGCLGSFQFGVIKNKVAMSICEYVLLYFFGEDAQCTVDESHGR